MGDIDIERAEAVKRGANLISSMENEIKQLRDAHKHIVAILGPEAINCGCDGCHEEMSQALDIAKKALEEKPI